MIYAEEFCAGRIASQEAFDFDVRSPKGALNLEISRNKEILYQFDYKKNLFTANVIVKRTKRCIR
jgi:hypothetical protein